MTLLELKQAIWAKCNRSMVDLQVAADKAGVTLPVTSIPQAEKLLKSLTPKSKKPKPKLRQEYIDRYRKAYDDYQRVNFPAWHKDGHAIEAVVPDTGTANGLTTFICNFIKWQGYRATRINVSGRQINDKWIKSSTRKGTADISATIKGKSLMIEIKAGKDRPSLAQLKEQERERKAGGEYVFIKSVEEFFTVYDSFCLQGSIFDLHR